MDLRKYNNYIILLECHPLCTRCTGPSENECTACLAPLYHVGLDIFTTTCYCVLGYYYNTTTQDCQGNIYIYIYIECHEYCEDCLGPTESQIDCKNCKSTPGIFNHSVDGCICLVGQSFYELPGPPKECHRNLI